MDNPALHSSVSDIAAVPNAKLREGERRVPIKAHLLIVDDEANTLASLSRAFRLAGHEATVCDNAAKGSGIGEDATL